MFTINNFLFKAQIDNINLFKVGTETASLQPCSNPPLPRLPITHTHTASP